MISTISNYKESDSEVKFARTLLRSVVRFALYALLEPEGSETDEALFRRGSIVA